jgi:hypothetical protein
VEVFLTGCQRNLWAREALKNQRKKLVVFYMEIEILKKIEVLMWPKKGGGSKMFPFYLQV